jgi:aminoglycoside phosphotransferase family enzyme/predicted kinase
LNNRAGNDSVLPDSAEAESSPQAVLFSALQDPRLYDHEVSSFEVIETHISRILLTGPYAYKIKKPVNFGFVDFTTLERRRHFCHEEVRLNRRYSPELYLDVVPITGSIEHPRPGGRGEAVEYAVRMRQFPPGGLLSRLAAERRLEAEHIDQIIEIVAEFHGRIDAAGRDSRYGLPDRIHHWVMENFAHVEPLLNDEALLGQLGDVRDWCENEARVRGADITARRENGFVRECHGDLHLGNMTLIEGKVTLFDCIEFNDELRWIDVMSDVAFAAMDLTDRGYPEYASRFLNGYLQHTGDYAGLGVLRYYQVYRAMVRAKVTILRLAQGVSEEEQAAILREYSGYADLARRYTLAQVPAVIITHGLSGSGKSTFAARLVERLGAVQVRSDIERKRLFGFRPAADTGSAPQGGIYTADASRRTYEALARNTTHLVEAGYTVIVDAAFLRAPQRDMFRALAARRRIPFLILDFHAPRDVLQRRIARRAGKGGDPSEADADVLEAQMRTEEPLRRDDERSAVTIDAASGSTLEIALGEIRRRLGR